VFFFSPASSLPPPEVVLGKLAIIISYLLCVCVLICSRRRMNE
jgi:hypothetical protein